MTRKNILMCAWIKADVEIKFIRIKEEIRAKYVHLSEFRKRLRWDSTYCGKKRSINRCTVQNEVRIRQTHEKQWKCFLKNDLQGHKTLNWCKLSIH
jgi:hypothetical protein